GRTPTLRASPGLSACSAFVVPRVYPPRLLTLRSSRLPTAAAELGRYGATRIRRRFRLQHRTGSAPCRSHRALSRSPEKYTPVVQVFAKQFKPGFKISILFSHFNFLCSWPRHNKAL